MGEMMMGILVLLLSLPLTALGTPTVNFLYPPVDFVQQQIYVRGTGVARADNYDTGEFSLNASATESDDSAAAIASWEVTASLGHELSAGATVQVTLGLAHVSGSDGLEWGGQLCCNTVATPYLITPSSERRYGPSVRLEGSAVPEAAGQLVRALDTLSGSPWLSADAWQAAAELSEPTQEDQGRALLDLLRALDSKLPLTLLLDALAELDYLHYQDIVFSFSADEAGDYTIGLELECWACGLSSETNIAWSLGRLEAIELSSR